MKSILFISSENEDYKILHQILEKSFVVYKKSTLEEAINFLSDKNSFINAIIMNLDNNKQGISSIKSYIYFSQIPIILVCDEKKDDEGIFSEVNEVLTQPFIPSVVVKRIKNVINLFGNSGGYDRLTGLFTRESFLVKASEMISSHDNGYYNMCCLNIENFKFINDQYGLDIGDCVLGHVGFSIFEFASKNSAIGCRLSSDRFAFLYEASLPNKYIIELHAKSINTKYVASPLNIRIGRYAITDNKMTVNAMLDRASLAETSIKGKYDVFLMNYDESMRASLVNNQQIVSEMDDALNSGQFEMWLQPQINHSNKKLIGAEALVRWRHPEGIIPPNDFIPIFEENGFIYELDKFIWEEACKTLKKWIDSGKKPVPISVNVSRCDIFKKDLVFVLVNLLRKYDIPIDLLRIEITESAFSKSTDQIIVAVNELIKLGFIVEIDDFGSGYSSLNTLKDVEASILKLDMRFLEISKGSKRGGNILESVCRMAKWLGMAVIAEGVETEEQADFLQTIGCNYIQGYLYSKPIPVSEFEVFEANLVKETRLSLLESLVNLDNNSFWNPQSIDTIIFNSYVGGACIFEMYNEKCELLRANEKYLNKFRNFFNLDASINALSPFEYMDSDSINHFVRAANQAIKTQEETVEEIVVLGPNDKKLYIQCTLRVIAHVEKRYLFYCRITDVTEQRIAEKKEQVMAERLKAIMDNSQSGITAVIVKPDGEIDPIFMNDRFYEILGYTREQFHEEVGNAFTCIVPEDYHRILEEAQGIHEIGESITMFLRAIKRDGTIVYLRNDMVIIKFNDIPDPVQLSNFSDITSQSVAEEKEHKLYEQLQLIMNNVNGGITATIVRDGLPTFVFANNQYYFQLGYTKEEFEAEVFNPFMLIIEDDRERVQNLFLDKSGSNELYTVEYRIKRKDGSIRNIQANSSIVKLIGIEENVHLCVYNDITDLRLTEKKLMTVNGQINAIIDNISSGISAVELRENGPVFLYANARYYDLFDEEKDSNMESDIYSKIHSLDRDRVKREINEAILAQEKVTTSFRVVKNDTISWINVFMNICRLEGSDNLVQLCVFTDITAIKEAEDELSNREKEYEFATKLSGNVICRYNISDKTISLRNDIAKIYSVSEKIEGVPYGRVTLGYISNDTKDNYISFYESIMNGEKEGKVLYQEKILGQWRWIKAHFLTVFSNEGHAVSAIISLHDFTEEMEKEAIYKKWKNSLKDRSNQSYTIISCDLEKNRSFDIMQGNLLVGRLKENEEVSFDYRTYEYAQKYVYKEDRHEYIELLKEKKLREDYEKGNFVSSLEYRDINDRGEIKWLRLTVELVEHGDNGLLVYLMYEDIDKQKNDEITIKTLALSDPLTGLLNRKAFIDKVNQFIDNSKKGCRAALFLLDLDRFKLINDNLGHAVGDQTLVTVGNTIKGVVSENDLVCRLGGDEFLVFVNDVKNKEEVGLLAKKICQKIQSKIDNQFHLSTSLGISLYQDDGKTFEELYNKADIALYRVKESGKNNYCFFSEKI